MCFDFNGLLGDLEDNIAGVDCLPVCMCVCVGGGGGAGQSCVLKFACYIGA